MSKIDFQKKWCNQLASCVRKAFGHNALTIAEPQQNIPRNSPQPKKSKKKSNKPKTTTESTPAAEPINDVGEVQDCPNSPASPSEEAVQPEDPISSSVINSAPAEEGAPADWMEPVSRRQGRQHSTPKAEAAPTVNKEDFKDLQAIIMYGVEEVDSEDKNIRNQHDLAFVTESFESFLGSDQGFGIINLFRIGRHGESDRPRPLKVRLRSQEDRDLLLSNRVQFRKKFQNMDFQQHFSVEGSSRRLDKQLDTLTAKDRSQSWCGETAPLQPLR